MGARTNGGFMGWLLDTDDGDFEGDTLIEAVKSAARYSVDDCNGEHSDAPFINRIFYFTDDEREITKGIDAVQQRLDLIAEQLKHGYNEGVEESREFQPNSYR